MNTKLKEYFHIIEQYRRVMGIPPHEKGDPVKVLELIEKVSGRGLMFPEEYREFLLRYNGFEHFRYDGFDFLGIMIYAPETRPSIMPGADVLGFIEVNRVLEIPLPVDDPDQPKYLPEEHDTFFGGSGTEEFMYDECLEKFCMLDRTSHKPNERFDTFNDMLLFILKPEVEDLKELLAEKRATG